MNWNQEKVVVTGGAGFIGHNLVKKLVESGAKVCVIDNLSKTDTNVNFLPEVEFRQADLLNSNVASEALKDATYCFHLAAKIGGIGYFHKIPAEILHDNLIIDLNLWEAARQSSTLKKIIGVSSSMVFENASTFPLSERALPKTPAPITAYGFSKLSTEYIAKAYRDQYGLSYLIIRPFNAYGDGEMIGEYIGYAHVIPDLINKVLSEQYPLEILGSGAQTRSYTYAGDIADAMVFLAERFKNDDFNVGTGVETSVMELSEKIWKLCGRAEPFAVRHMPAFTADVQRRVPDISKLSAIGWEPLVSLDDGLAKTIDWIKTQRRNVSK